MIENRKIIHNQRITTIQSRERVNPSYGTFSYLDMIISH
ncbi:hypothetical protein CY0110_19072 [Crocosphaera chwakensis CCY0110]|uniref:Uncharacterized protein n=1 Tax=Crocosphaera chwakensis CCY0110 TaxID=391612 RepID=A3IJE6_9CHRO|nr:hypothetical protein CY0110_19072 [Crocosphaera chwakensis CCY0110]